MTTKRSDRYRFVAEIARDGEYRYGVVERGNNRRYYIGGKEVTKEQWEKEVKFPGSYEEDLESEEANESGAV